MLIKLPIPYKGFDIKTFIESYGLTYVSVMTNPSWGYIILEIAESSVSVLTQTTVQTDFDTAMKSWTWDYTP